jgi:hypothetical protein
MNLQRQHQGVQGGIEFLLTSVGSGEIKGNHADLHTTTSKREREREINIYIYILYLIIIIHCHGKRAPRRPATGHRLYTFNMNIWENRRF